MIKFFDPLARLQAKARASGRESGVPEDLRSLFDTPLPKSSDSVFDCKIISLDFETTGMNFQKDAVISEGYAEIRSRTVDFSTAFHSLIKYDGPVNPGAAVVNQLTPELTEHGLDPKEALTELLKRLAGGVVITHCGIIEMTFIKKTLGLPDRSVLPAVFLDTMRFEQALDPVNAARPGALQLSAVRRRRGLPDYEGHNALADAVATAELFLAQVQAGFGKKKPALGALYKMAHA